MATGTSMKELKTSLGFSFPNTLSYSSPIVKTAPVILHLFEGLNSIRDRYSGYKARQIRTSHDIRQEIDELFHELGPALWPDFEKESKLPEWLLRPSSDPESHYPRQLYYSNPDHCEFLSEKFHTFVTLKLANRHHNIQCRRKRKSKSNTEAGSILDRDYQSSSEDLENLDDNDDSNIVFEENHNSDSEELALEPTELPVDNDPNQSTDCVDMNPNIAPTAPMLAGRGSMGNTPSKLSDAEARYSHPKLAAYRKQHESSDNNATRHSYSYSGGADPPDASTTTAAAAEASNNTNSKKRITRKRPVDSGTAEPGKKRNKFTPNVYDLKPSLIVILRVKVPLTNEKGASTRARTEPTQQPRVQTPTSELEENVAQPPPPPPPFQPPLDITDSIARTQPDLHQPVSYRQNATSDPRTSKRNPGTKILMPYDLRMPDSLPAQAFQNDKIPEVGHAMEQTSTQEKGDTASDASNDRPVDTHAGQSIAVNESSDEPINPDVPMSKDIDEMASENLQSADVQTVPHTARCDLVNQDRSLIAETTIQQIEKTTPGASIKQTTEAEPITHNAVEDLYKASAKDLDILLCKISVLLRPQRDNDMKLPVAWITLEGVRSSGAFFQKALKVLQRSLEPGEEFTRVHITQTSGRSIGNMQTGIFVERGCEDNISWKKLLESIQDLYKTDTVGFQLEMAADLYVEKKVDAKV